MKQQKASDYNIDVVHDIEGDFLKMRQYRGRHKRYDGEMSNVIEREVFVTPYQAAGMLLYDPEQQKIATIEQFRFGAIKDNHSPWIQEIVMGMMDAPNESPQQTAIREAKEEAGATVKRVVPITSFYPSPGILSEFMHLFCGEVDITTLGGYHGLAEEDEDIKVTIMSLDEVEKALSTGKIKSAVAIIALQWLLLNKTTLWQ